MNPFYSRLTRLAGPILCAWLVCIAAASAQDPSTTIISVEEQWELSVGEPTPERSSPQTSMVMSPLPHLDGLYFIFTLNYQNLPNYIAGGMQIQQWDGDTAVSVNDGPKEGTLEIEDEFIRWTQRMSINEGQLTFEILGGSSATWGAFGGQGYLKRSVQTSLTNLNEYRPAISLGESDVGYAGNRVVGLILKRLVWITEDGEEHFMEAPIDIDTDLDP
jgi:hypothetical protein